MTDTDNAAEAIPLRKRPIPDRLDYFAEKLAAQLDVDKLPRDAAVAMGATIINLGVIATEVRTLLDEREQLRAQVADADEGARGTLALASSIAEDRNLKADELAAAIARAKRAEALAEQRHNWQLRLAQRETTLMAENAELRAWLDELGYDALSVDARLRRADGTAATDTGKATGGTISAPAACWNRHPDHPLPCGRSAGHEGQHARGERRWDGTP